MIPSLLKLITILALWFAGLGAAMQFAKMAVPFSLLQQAYPDAGSELGWLLSIPSLIGCCLGIVVGGLLGQLGERKTLFAGLLIGAAVSLFQAQIPGFSAMLASRLIEGISHLVIVVAAPTLIAQIAPVHLLGVSMALWSTFFGVAFAFVAWVGIPFIANDRLDMLFSWHGWYMLLMAAIIIVLVPGNRQRNVVPNSNRTNLLLLHAKTYSSPNIATPGVGWLFYTLTFVSILALLPALLESSDTQWIGGFLPLLSIAVSLLFVPVLGRKIASFQIVILGFALATSFILLHLALAIGLMLPIALFAVFGLLQGGSFGSVPELNLDATDRALAYGFIAQTGNFGNLFGTPVLLYVLNSAGVEFTYFVIAALYAAAIVFLLLLSKFRSAA